jgi:hypothetical protein
MARSRRNRAALVPAGIDDRSSGTLVDVVPGVAAEVDVVDADDVAVTGGVYAHHSRAAFVRSHCT